MIADPTPFLSIYARRRLSALAREDVRASQQRILSGLIAKAAKTEFGCRHDFVKLRSIEEYQRAVPLRRYDNFWDEFFAKRYPVLDNVTWPGLMPFFANSSGTSSGVTKHIPVSAAMVRANQRAAFDLLTHHIAGYPQSRVLGGKNFLLGGSPALTPVAPGVQAGDLSGIAAAHVPWWAKHFYYPSGENAALTDWEEKSRKLAASAAAEDIRSLSGTPSWVLLFLEEMQRRQPGDGRLASLWPNLELVVHGGVSFAPYRSRYGELLAGSHAQTREVYPASEGFIALQDKTPEDGLRLLTDNGLFFEFVPVEELDSPSPTRHWLGTAETGVNYALVLTTNAGLWSYVIGDTVRLVPGAVPRLFVTGRLSYGLSAFGEHLIGEEIEAAVSQAAAALGLALTDYMVGPVFAGNGPGHHLFLIEPAKAPDRDLAAAFAAHLDRELAAHNTDYAEHRAGNFGMAAPEVKILPPGRFAEWMKARGKFGGQNKVPRVLAEAGKFRETVTALLRG